MNYFFGGNFQNNYHNVFTNNYRAYPMVFFKNHKEDWNSGGKIIMPQSALGRLSMLNVQYPMLFQLSNTVIKEKKTHCGVLEFTAEEGKCYLPFWMMEVLCIQEGTFITVENKTLKKGNFVKVQPHLTAFINISNPKAVLEQKLRNFSCLTKGDDICIEYNNKNFYLNILEVKPDDAETHAISIVETDINVEFAPPRDYKEPEKKKEEVPKKKLQPRQPRKKYQNNNSQEQEEIYLEHLQKFQALHQKLQIQLQLPRKRKLMILILTLMFLTTKMDSKHFKEKAEV